MGSSDDKERRIRELEARVAELETQSAEHFRQLLEGLPQLIWATDEDGGPTYFNARWRNYSGALPDENQSYRHLVHPDDWPVTSELWTQARRTGQPLELEYRLLGKDGSYRWFLVRGWPIHDAQRKIVSWIGTATDVHELRQAQEALREADRRKDDFLAVLSHELRNPLAPIKNSVYVLEHAPPGSEPARHAIQVITRQVDQLVRLVGDLLDITRIVRGKVSLQKQRYDLGELLRRTMEDYRSLFDERHVTLVFQCDPTPIYIDGDGSRLTQVVGNLLHNAAKFSGQGGQTTVQLGCDPASRRAVLRVKDNGAGIAGDLLPRLFQPFMQADTTIERAQGGLGLGLALVKGLVELHGGDISAHSDGLGCGAEFIVRLPLSHGEGQSPRTSRGEAPGPRRRVLIIEDIFDVADSLHMVLKLGGHEVAVVDNGQKALQKARDFQPEVVLCDIGLPGMDGYAVARAFRADPEIGKTFLVALTGYARPEDLSRAAEAGFDRHIAKPPRLELIDEILRTLR
jgi:PAS domain S-box-containing protein